MSASVELMRPLQANTQSMHSAAVIWGITHHLQPMVNLLFDCIAFGHRYMSGQMTGHWLVLFAVQGPLVTLERSVKQAGRRHNVELPHWVSTPLTIAALSYLADLFFFPPAFITGVAYTGAAGLLRNMSTAFPAIPWPQIHPS